MYFQAANSFFKKNIFSSMSKDIHVHVYTLNLQNNCLLKKWGWHISTAIKRFSFVLCGKFDSFKAK